MKITYDQMCDFVMSHRDIDFSLSSMPDEPRDDVYDDIQGCNAFNDTVRAMYASCNVTFDDDAMYFNDATSLDAAYAIANEIIDSYNRDDDTYETKFHCRGDDDVDYQGSYATILIDIARAMIA